MNFRIHRYQIPWPYHQSRTHSGDGALIEINIEGTRGYADLHPWPSLGDPTIDEQLAKLKAGSPTSQTLIALHLAKRDANARAANQPGLKFKNSLTTHKLVFNEDLAKNNFEQLASMTKSQTKERLFKLKLSPSSIADVALLIEHAVTMGTQIKWRLDANSLFIKSEVINFWKSLSGEARKTISYIEDPCVYTFSDWSDMESAGIPLAIDFEIKNWQQAKRDHSPTASKQTIFILKPAIQNSEYWIDWLKIHPHQFTVTNYLDHPAGLLHAIWSGEIMNEALPSLCLPGGFSLTMNNSNLNKYWPGLIFNDTESRWTGALSPGIGFQSQFEKLDWANL